MEDTSHTPGLLYPKIRRILDMSRQLFRVQRNNYSRTFNFIDEPAVDASRVVVCFGRRGETTVIKKVGKLLRQTAVD